MAFINEYKILLINYFYYIDDINKAYLLILLIFFSIIILSIPIPGSFVVAINASFFGIAGFLISFISALISSILIYFFYSKLPYNFKPKEIQKIAKYKNNLYLLTILRSIIPFPVGTYIYVILKIKFKYFILSTALGIIPGTLSITLMFSSIKKSLIERGDISFFIFNDPLFIFSLVFVFTVIFISSILKKKFL
tara:strand:+ start:2661 stop:3242 length:582 start_codon:yes stop_codon:yes gene_type:complete